MWADVRARYALLALLVALAASLVVAGFRFRVEGQTKRVELAIDYSDFLQLAQSYDYNPTAFLVELRRAGLTSLALSEELGANAGSDGSAYVATGGALLAQSRLSPLHDPLLENLAVEGRLNPNAVYILVWNPMTYERYYAQLPLHFMGRSVRVLRPRYPWLFEVRTQAGYFNNVGLGIPIDQLLLAKRLKLLVIPRLQNDERFAKSDMDHAIDQVLRYNPKVSTLVFSGLNNEVWGYPDHLNDAAAMFLEKRHPFNYGTIETYAATQVQKGDETLARQIPGRTVRVQAISRTELEKLSLDDVVDRYVLGVRERNVRVIYLRTWQHRDGTLSIEETNVEMVRDIARELRRHGFSLGRASPVPLYHGDNRVLVGLAALGVPSIFTVLLLALGWFDRRLVLAAYAVTALVYGAGLALHHDMFARSLIALAGALLFSAAAFLVLAPAFAEPLQPTTRAQLLRSLRTTLLASGTALLGALLVVGIMSSPLAMEEIEPFRGVKLVLTLPPLIALLLYAFGGTFDAQRKPRDIVVAPLRAYDVLIGSAVAGAAALLVIRSGNEGEIAPSHAELLVRRVLESVLSVRPRFKEFLVGYPCMMLVPALLPLHRRYAGWLLALGAGVGIGDIIDTFSHLHTPLVISLLRVFNGLWIGIAIGAIAIWLYRRIAV